ncbi:unnamed protein product [Parnassius apollo]|uniref:(apollo) hypothetical protein n=1 Tax=Parnassius apollo TaxID=110799 RepID=A0A8S3WN18_PARAO|nr:unnamed protein product [Parnassius apollo]
MDAAASTTSVPLSPPAASADTLKETASTANDLYIDFSTTFEPQVNTSSIPLQESRNSRQSPLPSTSNSTNIEQIILDLQLSDSNNSPYVDSESSYHPENNKPATSSDTSRDEIEETNVRKKSKKANPDTWKRNIAKNKRQSGKSYTNRKGNIVSARNCIPTNCSKCRYKCNENFTENTLISKAKKKDLMTLLKDGVIPKDYVDYYTNIPSIDEENIINDCSGSESVD